MGVYVKTYPHEYSKKVANCLCPNKSCVHDNESNNGGNFFDKVCIPENEDEVITKEERERYRYTCEEVKIRPTDEILNLLEHFSDNVRHIDGSFYLISMKNLLKLGACLGNSNSYASFSGIMECISKECMYYGCPNHLFVIELT